MGVNETEAKINAQNLKVNNFMILLLYYYRKT
jgi:hypothetical protein